MRSELLSILKEASPDTFTSELHDLLVEDARYWKRFGPSLEENWWTGAGASGPVEAEYMRSRVQQTRQHLDWARATSGDKKTTDAAAAIHELWRSDARLSPAAAWIGVPARVARR